jgi:hypothetical protein
VDCGSGGTASSYANPLFTKCDYGSSLAGMRTITVSNPDLMTYTGDFCSGGAPTPTSCSNAAARDISQWGAFTFRGPGYFYGASNLTATATDVPTVLSGISLLATFQAATSFNADVSGWDESGVTSFENMFAAASAFNQSLASWDMHSAAPTSGAMNGMLSSTAVSRSNLNATFAGWSGSAWFSSLGTWSAALGAGGRTYSDLASYTALNAKGFTTTATYIAGSTFVISYSADGGAGTLPSAGSYTEFSTPYTVAANVNLVNAGLEFYGWSTLSGGLGTIYQPGDLITPSASITLFANWVTAVPNSSALPPIPPPWLQAYERPGPDAGCVDGWRPSWAQWPSNGLGGYTCERTEFWSRGTASWAINPGFNW